MSSIIVFHIDDYSLSVVAVDGVPVVATSTDSINVCAGQSYDVVVTGRSVTDKVPSYIVKMSTDMLTGSPPPAEKMIVIGQANQQDGNKPSTDPGYSWSPSNVLDDFNLVPLDGQKLLTNPTNKIHFATNQSYFPGIGTRIAVGDQPYVEPKVPSLFTALTTGNASTQSSTYGPGTVPQILKKDEVVQIYMENSQPYPHPMHLHGHDFQVAGRGSGSWDGQESSLHSTPMRRDTGTFLFPLSQESTRLTNRTQSSFPPTDTSFFASPPTIRVFGTSIATSIGISQAVWRLSSSKHPNLCNPVWLFPVRRRACALRSGVLVQGIARVSLAPSARPMRIRSATPSTIISRTIWGLLFRHKRVHYGRR